MSEVLLKIFCFVSAVETKKKKGGWIFILPIFGSNRVKKINLHLRMIILKTKIRKPSGKRVHLRRKRVEACGLAVLFQIENFPHCNRELQSYKSNCLFNIPL